MRPSLLREFLRLEAASGIVLFAAAALALILVNTPLEWLYDKVLDTPVAVDQRRTDGDFLPADRTRNKARSG